MASEEATKVFKAMAGLVDPESGTAKDKCNAWPTQRSWVCSREAGHRGPHRASGIHKFENRILDEWTDADNS